MLLFETTTAHVRMYNKEKDGVCKWIISQSVIHLRFEYRDAKIFQQFPIELSRKRFISKLDKNKNWSKVLENYIVYRWNKRMKNNVFFFLQKLYHVLVFIRILFNLCSI